jgi:hypothetical protein
MEKKTSAYIETVDVTNVTYPNATIVRPPAYLKVVRCTVIFQQPKENLTSVGFLSTASNLNELNVLGFSNYSVTNTAVPPDQDFNINRGLQQFVFDRLGVGYMVDNFFVSSDGNGGQFVFIWEGIIQST